MAEILKVLSVGGDIGIWLLIGITWRFHDRLLRLELNHQGHADMDAAEFKRINTRLDNLED
jgi:hypothetical protein